MNKDTLVGVFGAVILVAAMIGVFYYEGSQPAVPGGGGALTFNVVWQTSRVDGPGAEGDAALNQAENAAVSVAQRNVTRAEFTFTWAASNCDPSDVTQAFPPSPGNVRLTVDGPGAIPAKSDTKDTGEIRLAVENLTSPPTVGTVQADSEADAAARLSTEHSSAAGTGDWALTIELLNGGESRDPNALIPQALATCSGITWQVSSGVTVYRATVSR